METAKNGYDIFQKLQKTKNLVAYDLVLLDLNMPIMNGFQACQNICKLYENSLFSDLQQRAEMMDNKKLGESVPMRGSLDS